MLAVRADGSQRTAGLTPLTLFIYVTPNNAVRCYPANADRVCGYDRSADTPTTERDLLDRAQQHAVDVAAEHFPDLPVETFTWEVSHRRQRSAGATRYDPATGEITFSLAWDAFEQHGWEQFSSTVRHELIHAWQYHEFGEADHGRTFERWTDALDTTQHCERFTSPNWWVICEDWIHHSSQK